MLELTAEQRAKFTQEELDEIAEYANSMKYYRDRIPVVRFWHYALSSGVIVFATLSPLLAIGANSADPKMAVFGLSKPFMAQAAIAISIAVALVEAARQIYKPGSRWAECYLSKNQLDGLWFTYKLRAPKLPQDAPERVALLEQFRGNREQVEKAEATTFFDNVTHTRQEGAPKAQ